MYRESQLIDQIDNSNELIKQAIGTITTPEVSNTFTNTRDTILSLKVTASEMVANSVGYQYDKDVLLTSLLHNCGDDIQLYESFRQNIEQHLDEGKLKKVILNYKRSIDYYFKDLSTATILNKASQDFNFRRDKIDRKTYLQELITKLEELSNTQGKADPAILTEVDFENRADLDKACDVVEEQTAGSGIIKFGWQGLNDMLEGGGRRGETIVANALQHKYKTGFTLSLFTQGCIFNKPHMLDSGKIPLNVRISFEDPLALNYKFIYTYLKYNETLEPVSLRSVTKTELSGYIKERLTSTGYRVKTLHVDPTKWSYRDIVNKIIEFESQGFEIHMLMHDYLSMVPTTFCTQGAMGADIRDLFRRIRIACLGKNILHITPHQLSTQAMDVLRTGISEENFIKEIGGKGYTSGSKQINQELDGEINLHAFRKNKKDWLSINLSKHRGFVIDQSNSYMLLPFPPKKMPIPHDLDRETPIHHYKIPSDNGDGDNNDGFGF